MASGGDKPPQAPDPGQILGLQNQYNHYNTSGPFGSQQWSSGGSGGHDTLTTNMSPQMQGAMDRAFAASATPLQKQYVPQGVDQLTSGILGKVGSHYGLSGSGMNTNLQQQKPQQGMSPQPPQGMPQMGQLQHGMPGGMGGPQSWQQIGSPGGMSGSGMGSQMGAGQGGMQSSLMGPLMQAMMGQQGAPGQSNSGGNQLGGMAWNQMGSPGGGGNTMPTNRTMI